MGKVWHRPRLETHRALVAWALMLQGLVPGQHLYGNWPQYTLGIVPYLGVEMCPRAAGDLNGDGISDVVVGSGGCTVRICLSDGTGNFRSATLGSVVPCGTFRSCYALVDVDGDHDLDLLCGYIYFLDSPVTLYRNDGQGNFTYDAASMPTALRKALAITGIDVDRDGDQDLIIGCSDGTQTLLYLNTGGGHFVDATAARLPGCTDRIQGIATLDVNQDGAPDFVTTAGGYYGTQPIRLWVNDGTGRFTFGSLNASCPGMKVRVGDFNGDMLPDVVIATFTGPIVVMVGDGNGGLRDESYRFPTSLVLYAYDVAVLDVDEDGDRDLVFAITGGPGVQSTRLYLNDGQGYFRDATHAMQPYAPAPTTIGVALEPGDFDGDGDQDFLYIFGPTTIGAPSSTILFHLRRQLVTQTTVTVGQNLTLTHYALHGHVMVAAASAGAPPVILGNLGRFWLDPAQMVLLTPLVIGSSGNAALTLPVPPDSRLRGQIVWTQAIDIDGTPPFAARLTNAVWNRIQ